tara:strand:- start:1685 stop:2461 length:777 start_codon:yes stop_codon:yes gene_type:complete
MADVTNYTIENASGANVRTDLNAVFGAIQSSNSKSSDLAASQCVAGMPFLNTTTNILKIRNSTNGGFTEIGNIDQDNLGLLSKAGGTMTGQLLIDDSSSASTPALSFDTDTDLGLFRKSANVMGFSSSGTERLIMDSNGLTLQSQNELRFADSDSSHHVGFQAPATVSSNIMWTLPSTDAAAAGYALVSDASGNLSWAASVGGGAVGGGNDQVFYENDQVVTQNYTITAGKNAMSAGPVTVQSGVVVTVGSGQSWTVV